MIKLNNTIVDEKLRLIGFVAEGKGRDFDQFTDEKMVTPLKLQWFADRNFKNKQVAISADGIKQLNKFKINSLPMVALVGQEFVPVDNSIALTKRYLNSNNDVVGFDVLINGTEKPYSYKNVVDLSFWFNPSNFVIKNSATGNIFIAGKPGTRLEDLPTEVIGEKSQAKRTRSAAQPPTPNTGNVINEFDILDVYEYIQSVNGLILMLPNEKYKATGEATSKTADTFLEMGIGEVGSPFVQVGEIKLNANTRFKKPGIINIEFGGGRIPIQTYVWRTKTLFRNGDNHVKRFGAVIPKANSSEFIDKFSTGMVMTPITDTGVTQPFTALIGRNDVDFYEIDASKLGMLVKSKVSGSILSNEDIYNKMLEMHSLKLALKYLGTRAGLLKDLKAQGVQLYEAGGRNIMPLFASMSQEFRDKIEAEGVNLYDGSFTMTQKIDKTPKNGSGAEKEEDDTVSIQYMIDGLDAGKITYAQMKNNPAEQPLEVRNIIISVGL